MEESNAQLCKVKYNTRFLRSDKCSTHQNSGCSFMSAVHMIRIEENQFLVYPSNNDYRTTVNLYLQGFSFSLDSLVPRLTVCHLSILSEVSKVEIESRL